MDSKTSLENKLTKALNELKKSEERYQDVVENAEIAIVIADKDANITYLNDKACQIVGYSKAELETLALQNIIHPDDLVKIFSFQKACMKGKKSPTRFECRIIRKDRSIRFLNINLGLLKKGQIVIGSRSYIVDITEYKNLEDAYLKSEKEQRQKNMALQASEEKLRNFMESSTEGFAILDSKLNFVECNEMNAKILGLKRTDIIGKNAVDISPDIKKTGRYDRYKEVIRNGKPFVVEDLIPHPALGNLHLRLRAFKVGFGLGIIITDITKMKRTEIALSQSQKFTKKIFSSLQDGLSVLDNNGKHLEVNPAFCSMTGFAKEEIIGVGPPHPYWPEEEVDNIQKEFEKIQQEGFHEVELVFQRKNGDQFPVLVSPAKIKNENSEVINYLFTFKDITEQKNTEKKLEEELEIRKNLLDGLPCVALILKKGTREIVASNKAARDIGAVPGKTCFKTCAQRDDHCRFCLAPEVWATNEPRQLEVEYRGKFYEGIWLPYKDDLYVHYIFDITERKSAEAAVRKSEAWSRLITDNVPILIGYVDKDMRYQFVNKVYEEWFGAKKEKILGKKVKDILDENTFKRSSPFIQKALKGVSSEFEGQLKLPNGEIKYFHNHLVPNVLSDGTNDGYYVVVTDITEMKKSEEKIKASLREKEVLLQEVHHRVKNNLQVISSLLRLQADFSQDERIEDILRISHNRIKSMALVHEKLYRSKDLAKINLKLYIKALVNDLFRSFAPFAGKIDLNILAQEIELKVEQAPYLGLIINELVSNSLKHAFPEGKDGQIDVSLQSKKNGNIELVVSDNGIGLPDDFEQLKTKTLGLHLVSLLVNEQLNGSLYIDTKAGTKYQIEIKE